MSTGDRPWAWVGTRIVEQLERGAGCGDHQGDTNTRRGDPRKHHSTTPSDPSKSLGVGDRDGRQSLAPPDRTDKQPG